MSYQMIAVDMDGTLLTSSGEVLPGTRAAFAAARASGVVVCIASGRTAVGVANRLRRAGLDPADFLLLGCNGGTVVDGATGDELIRRPLDSGVYRELVAFTRGLEAPAEVVLEPPATTGGPTGAGSAGAGTAGTAGTAIPGYLDPTRRSLLTMIPEGGQLIVEGDVQSPWIDFDAEENGFEIVRVPDLAAIPPPLKVQFVANVPLIRQVAPLIEARFTGRAALAFSAPAYFEANQLCVDKGSTLALLAQQLGFGLEHVIAFGDQGNDLAMIAAAGLGVAMGNATDEVKAVADRVTATNDEEGIAVLLGEVMPR